MAGDPTQPADDAFIDLLGKLVRDRFNALTNGDIACLINSINYRDRSTDDNIPNDPPESKDTVQLFAKKDAQNIAQLFIRHSGAISQMSFGQGGETPNVPGYIILGNALINFGVAALPYTPGGIESFVVTDFPKAYKKPPPTVVITPYRKVYTGRPAKTPIVSSISATQFTTRIVAAEGAPDLIHGSVPFGWISIGGIA